MQLVTAELRRGLLANGAERGADHVPVLKLFDPCGAATWLIAEMRPDDPDTLFGLCDLGHGFPELGQVSLAEIAGVRGRLGLGIERDFQFAGRYPLSVYAEAARHAGRIVEFGPELKAAAGRHGTKEEPR